ncbi:MAG: Heparinase N-terminus, partial [Solirubrobacteraceae bacterium]|nr:Heparinase N-terminus [Solirubrobacteraceae bacterium]
MSAAPAAPEQELAPRPVFCVVDAAHRDLEVADAACAGRFTVAGVTVELGPEPDWMGAALPADEEWRIEWTKFSYGLDLAHAYGRTGEELFLHAWERLVGTFIRAVPIGAGVDSPAVAARRVQHWVYARAAFAAAPRYPGLRDGL